ncbi:MAG: aldo/keto reductase [Acidimicrobiia bacterium]|nr:aldo/keto reductase [Acidimicrobiia bacterium]MBT8217571.1 aldo/keto reductase [Acidimicrobiia bacterium]NNF11066.1 aldo/keto reductase [Acidimicrobiia bacterium]NNL69561.1 aldo/keto reductase [Acidimicrobiia bacterium]
MDPQPFLNPLGSRTGLNVSAVGTGLWSVAGSEWGPADDKDTLDAIEASLDLGVNFFDTADVYAGGHSEELLGLAMKGRRERFIVATKIGWTGFDGEHGRSHYDTAAKLIAGVEDSLRRLDTDYIDVIQCHIFFTEPNTPVFIEGFRQLKEAGKVRAWGISTGELGPLQAFNADGDCDVLQIDYSILNRTPESEIFPYCREAGIGVIVRGPLAMGLLADKYDASATFPDNDFRHNWIEDPEQNEQFLRDLETVAAIRSAVPDGQTMAEFALRFVLSHSAVSTAIPGARNARQARSNAAAGRLAHLSGEESRHVDRIVFPGGGRKIWPA